MLKSYIGKIAFNTPMAIPIQANPEIYYPFENWYSNQKLVN